jgi:dienelactone hydrolase
MTTTANEPTNKAAPTTDVHWVLMFTALSEARDAARIGHASGVMWVGDEATRGEILALAIENAANRETGGDTSRIIVTGFSVGRNDLTGAL